jgi:hypothetical protein
MSQSARRSPMRNINVMDLNNGRRRWMEHNHDGRREYGRGRATRAGAAPASGSGGATPASSSSRIRLAITRGAHNIEQRERCERVDRNEPRGPDRKSHKRRRRVDEHEPQVGRPSHMIVENSLEITPKVFRDAVDFFLRK